MTRARQSKRGRGGSDEARAEFSTSIYFTGFPITKVQILTRRKALQTASSTAFKCIRWIQYFYFCTSKASKAKTESWIRQILVSHESKYAALAQRHGAARVAGRLPAPSASVFVLLYQ